VTYTELVAAISAYTENVFSTADMNTFITQAEQRIFTAIQFPCSRKTATAVTVANNPYFSCPTDFLESYSLAVYPTGGAHSFLLNKDVSFIREAYPIPSSTGTPKYYAMFGPDLVNPQELRFIFGPTPDVVYNIELQYFFYPESITTVVGGQTWLGDNFDTVLLYGSLVEAYIFMKGEDDMMNLYNTKFNEALILAKKIGDGLEKGDAYRYGQLKVGVT
jgi:hypothetical protein